MNRYLHCLKCHELALQADQSGHVDFLCSPNWLKDAFSDVMLCIASHDMVFIRVTISIDLRTCVMLCKHGICATVVIPSLFLCLLQNEDRSKIISNLPFLEQADSVSSL